MTDLHMPSDTEVYNDGYNNANDTEQITTGVYDSPTNNDEHQSRNVEQHSHILKQQPQNVEQRLPNIEQKRQNMIPQPLNYVQQDDRNTDHGQRSSTEQRQPFIAQYTTIQQPMKPRSNTDLRCEAILFCLCCFWPTGIAAIIYAQKAVHAYKEGKIADGNRYYSRTDKLIIASILIGMLILLLFFIIKQMTQPTIYTKA